MSVKKQFIKTKPVCKVTFAVEAKESNSVAVVGDFNNWNPSEGELAKLKNGTLKVFSNYQKTILLSSNTLLMELTPTNQKQIVIDTTNLRVLKIAF